MAANLRFDFTVDKAAKKITIIRAFAAPVNKVWESWTKKEHLDQWWAPKPYKAVTKSLDFKVGGRWLYAMTGPDNFEQYCKVDYKTVESQKGFTANDAFCDANGVETGEFPGSQWDVSFDSKGDTTEVTIVITYKKVEDLEKTIEMGFKEGFTAGLGNLDELLAS